MTGLLRDNFPFFEENPDIVYFDNAATSQKLKKSLDRLIHFYSCECSNVGRSSYKLSGHAMEEMEKVRKKIADYIGCECDEIIFTKSATEASNLVCASFLPLLLHEGDNVVTSALEHNSVMLPLKIASEKAGAELRIVSPDKNTGISPDDFEKKTDIKTVFAAITCASNVSGSETGFEKICSSCRNKGIVTMLDASQMLSHRKINVRELECDFLFFSAHKMYSVSGCGVLYAKREHIEKMEPLLYGGGIVESISPLKIIEGNKKFESGSPDVGAILAFGEAIDFLSLNEEDIIRKEKTLCRSLAESFEEFEGKVSLLGTMNSGIPIASFTVPGISCYDIGSLLSANGICVRTGRMCAHKLFDSISLEGCVRVSLGAYNTIDEIEFFSAALKKILGKFRYD